MLIILGMSIELKIDPARFVEDFIAIASEKQIENVFLDGVVTSEEVRDLLDLDKNKQFQMNDLKLLVQKKGWGNFKTIYHGLKAWGFDAYRSTNDLEVVYEDEEEFIDLSPSPFHQQYVQFWKDREFVLAQVEINGKAIHLADPTLQMDPDILLTALKTYDGVLNILVNLYPVSENLDLYVEANKISSKIIELIPATDPRYFDLALSSVSRWGANLALVKHPYNSLLDIIKAAVRSTEGAWDYIPIALRQSDDFALQMALINFNILGEMEKDQQMRVWTKVLEKLRAQGIDLLEFLQECGAKPAEIYIDSYEHFKYYMENYSGITTDLGRFRSLNTLYHVWKNRIDPVAARQKPTVMLVYPEKTADHNGVFSQFGLADTLIESGKFNVIYAEARNEEDVKNAFEATTDHGRFPHLKIFLAAHSDRNGMYFQKERSEKTSIDPSDFPTDFSHLSSYLLPEGEIYLYGCSTGIGGEEVPNMMGHFASVLSSSMKVRAHPIPGNIASLHILDDLSLDIKLAGGVLPVFTYGKLASPMKRGLITYFSNLFRTTSQSPFLLAQISSSELTQK